MFQKKNVSVTEVVQPEHRLEFCSIVVRLLYGRMLTRGSRASASAARRARIFGFLSRLSASELRTLLDVALEPFVGAYTRSLDIDDDDDATRQADAVMLRISTRKQTGDVRK